MCFALFCYESVLSDNITLSQGKQRLSQFVFLSVWFVCILCSEASIEMTEGTMCLWQHAVAESICPNGQHMSCCTVKSWSHCSCETGGSVQPGRKHTNFNLFSHPRFLFLSVTLFSLFFCLPLNDYGFVCRHESNQVTFSTLVSFWPLSIHYPCSYFPPFLIPPSLTVLTLSVLREPFTVWNIKLSSHCVITLSSRAAALFFWVMVCFFLFICFHFIVFVSFLKPPSPLFSFTCFYIILSL